MRWFLNRADSFWEWLRTTFFPVLHACFDERVMFEAWSGIEQYAGTLEMDEDEIETHLRALGFNRNPVAALKSRSWAPGDVDGVSEGSWVRRERPLTSFQLHVTLFSNEHDGTYDLLAHWEPSWIRHPIRHYRSEEVDSEEGVDRIIGLLASRRVYPFSRSFPAS